MSAAGGVQSAVTREKRNVLVRPVGGVTRVARLCALVLLYAILAAALASPASAAFGLAAFDGAALGPDGKAYTQAGGHPYVVSTTFLLNSRLDATGVLEPDGGAVKDIEVELPPGLIGNPTAVTPCPMGVFLATVAGFPCPTSSQVGVTRVKIAVGNQSGTLPTWPVYSLEPAPGAVASFAFSVVGVPVFLDAIVRSEGGYHVVVVAHDASKAVEVLGSEVTLWGDPADPGHDSLRACPNTSSMGCSTEVTSAPFLTNPTACPAVGEGLETRLRANSWDNPDVFAEASFISHDVPGYVFPPFNVPDPTRDELPPDKWGPPLGTTGCDQLPFDPSMSVVPDSTQPDSPTGLSVELAFPQEGLLNKVGLASAHLRRAEVTLPKGMTVSPSSADGLKGCSDAEIGIGSDSPASCPPGSKIGTVTATTPVLDEPLEGGVYVGTQTSDDPASGKMFRIFLVLENEARGLLVKLPGQVRVDEATGRITTIFANNPQLPVSRITLALKSGPRAPLAMPPDCGAKTVEAELSSWGGQTAHLESSFAVDCPSALGAFSPSFAAGSTNPTGGAFSPFVVRINRPDRQQYLGGLALRMPGGLLAKLKGVPLCDDGAAAAGTCPAASRVGTATVGAGPGSNPYYLKGSVSLTGPYGGGPYGLSVAVRAVAGPFDLGMVVVRQAILIDPVDAHLTVRSDPLPVVIKGVPIRLRSVNVDVDRPGFTINPTSCAAKRIDADFISTLNTVARQSIRFQVGDCAALRFNPKLSLRLTGKGQTREGGHPGLRAVLTQRHGQAGIRGATVKLPLSLALDPENAVSDSLCSFEEGQKVDPQCPRSSIIGAAKAISPVLNRPLIGKVYFVRNVRIDKRTGRSIRTLPTLLVALRGEVALNLRATTSIAKNKLVNTFATVPDAPVSRFELTLRGGRKGVLVVTTDRGLCRSKQIASVSIGGQNGKGITRATAVTTPCKKSASR